VAEPSKRSARTQLLRAPASQLALPLACTLLLLAAEAACAQERQTLAPEGTRHARSAKAPLVPIGSQVSRTRLELQKRASA